MTFRVEILDDGIWHWYRDCPDRVEADELLRKLRERGYEARSTEIAVTKEA